MILFAAFLGMDGSDLKDVIMAVVGAVVLYLQFRSQQLAHAAKTSADEAKTEAAVGRTQAAEASTHISNKLDKVETSVNGRVAELLQEHGVVKKAEGKAEAIHDAAVIRDAVKEAVAAIPTPTIVVQPIPVAPPTPPASPGG